MNNIKAKKKGMNMRRVFSRPKSLISALFVLAVFAIGIVSVPASAIALEYEFYTPPSTTTGVPSMALGPDGNMWFTKLNQDKIGKVTPEGVITEYDIEPGDHALTITAGPDGNMWFTTYAKKIAKTTTSGSITYYDVSGDLGVDYAPWGITAGPDGNMWVNSPISLGSGALDGRIIKISLTGSVTVYNTSIGSKGIVTGSDGNIWFAMGGSGGSTNYIGRITTSGTITEFELPELGTGVSSMTLGPDGNIWYVRLTNLSGAGKIGKITPSGVATEYATGTSIFGQSDVAIGANGNIWFTDGQNSIIGEVDPNGNVSTYELPANTLPFSIALGSDQKIWFGNYLTIGKIVNTPIEPPVVEPPQNPNNPPTVPKSGKLLGAVIATVSLLSIVVLATLEVKKSSTEAKKSSK